MARNGARAAKKSVVATMSVSAGPIGAPDGLTIWTSGLSASHVT
jgi:hypothetical protein